MKVETHSVCNPDKKILVDPQEKIRAGFKWTDQVLRHLDDIRPDVTRKYVAALNKRLLDAVRGFRVDSQSFDAEEMSAGLSHLGNHFDLRDLIVRFTCMHLGLPAGCKPGPEEIEVSSLNVVKANHRLSYHRVKALVDLLGREEGIPLYKEVIARKLVADRVENERINKGEKEISSVEMIERAVKHGLRLALLISRLRLSTITWCCFVSTDASRTKP